MEQNSDQITTQVTDQIGAEMNKYLQATGSNLTSNITDMLFWWVIIPTLVFMVLFLLIYTLRAVRRHRVEKAIFEIRDVLVSQQRSETAPVANEQQATN